jgi:hypothetical protein
VGTRVLHTLQVTCGDIGVTHSTGNMWGHWCNTLYLRVELVRTWMFPTQGGIRCRDRVVLFGIVEIVLLEGS